MNYQKIIESEHSLLSNKKIICFKDNGASRKVIFNNNSRLDVIEIRIDGCFITNDIPKCDFMLLVPSGYQYSENFIELKGANVLRAVEQISSTIDYLSNNGIVHKTKLKAGYIACSRFPREDTTVQSLKIKMRRDYNLALTIKSQQIEINLV